MNRSTLPSVCARYGAHSRGWKPQCAQSRETPDESGVDPGHNRAAAAHYSGGNKGSTETGCRVDLVAGKRLDVTGSGVARLQQDVVLVSAHVRRFSV
jgi:hypothetical protein